MKKIMKKSGVLAAVCILATCLVGCGGASFDAAMYVKGCLDAMYLGDASKSYMDITDSTQAEIKESYTEGLEYEASYFLGYFEIDEYYIPASMVTEVVEMYRQIYSQSKYEVGAVTKSGDNYLVSVTIHPMDIIEKAIENEFDAFLESFYERAYDGAFDEMTDEEIEIIWARGVIDSVKARVGNIGHFAPETISVQVVVDSRTKNEVIYAISNNDIDRIDSLVIQY